MEEVRGGKEKVEGELEAVTRELRQEQEKEVGQRSKGSCSGTHSHPCTGCTAAALPRVGGTGGEV